MEGLFKFTLSENLDFKKMGVDSLYNLRYINVIRDSINPLIDRLQQKYNDIIEINLDAFKKIKLSRIDMTVVQKNVPFPVIVPTFLLLTTDNLIDYGKKIETPVGSLVSLKLMH